MIKLSLTEKELGVLAKHWERNICYGVGGTFGDGANFDSRAEYNSGKKILKKMAKLLNWPD